MAITSFMGTSTLRVSIKHLWGPGRRSEMIYGPVDIVNRQNSATIKKADASTVLHYKHQEDF